MEEKKDDQDEYRLDWMICAEMGPNATIERSSDLGARDMDRNHDWLNDGKQHYDDSDLADANKSHSYGQKSHRIFCNRQLEMSGITKEMKIVVWAL